MSEEALILTNIYNILLKAEPIVNLVVGCIQVLIVVAVVYVLYKLFNLFF